MTFLLVAQLLALGLIVTGLVAVILEIALKSPRAFVEIATDSERFALSTPSPVFRTIGTVPAKHEVANVNAPAGRHLDAA